MPRQNRRTPKQNRPSGGRRAGADDPLLRALREVADEALEESVPDRLLEVVRSARQPRGAGADGPEPPAGRRAPADEPG